MINMVITTSQRQGRRRETGSEGSPRQNCEPTYRKALRGRVPGTSQHQMTKSFGSGDTVKGPVVQRAFTLLSGETCLTGGPPATGAGLRPIAKAVDEPPDPTAVAEQTREVGLRTRAKAMEEPPNPTVCVSTLWSNPLRDETGVSRGHSSHRPAVMGGMDGNRPGEGPNLMVQGGACGVSTPAMKPDRAS